MKMTELAKMMILTAKVYGDKEVTLIEAGTGEVRYVQGYSFDVPGDVIEIEHVGFGELLEELDIKEFEI